MVKSVRINRLGDNSIDHDEFFKEIFPMMTELINMQNDKK